MPYSPQAVADHFHVAFGQLKPGLDIAPGRSIAVVRLAAATNQREMVLLHWGLIPPGARSTSMDDHLIFAKVETAMHQPACQDAFRSHRCLIPADGFYEWQKEHGHKQPYFVRLRNSHLFAFGGIWSRWQVADARAIESCAILTTESNPLVRPLHNRMPLIIRPEHYEKWLNPQTPLDQLQPLLAAYPAREMTAYPVSQKVNKPSPDEPGRIEPTEKHPGEGAALFRPLVEELHKPKQQKQSASEKPPGNHP